VDISKYSRYMHASMYYMRRRKGITKSCCLRYGSVGFFWASKRATAVRN